MTYFFFGFVKILDKLKKQVFLNSIFNSILNHDKISIDCIFVIPAPKLAIQM